MHSQIARDALRVSIKTSLVALAFIVHRRHAGGAPAGTKRFPGRNVITTLLELPLVLPPAVAGIALFAAFGRMGLLGTQLHALGIRLPFTWIAVVMAQAFVAMPFFVRQAIAGFASVDQQLRRRVADARRRADALLLPHRGAAGRQESLRRRHARLGARAGRVRRHRAVRRQPAGRHPDSATGHLLRVLGDQLRLRAAMSALLVAVSFVILIVTKVLLQWRVV